LKLRIEEGEANVRKEVAEVRDLGENRFNELKETMFKIDNRISANEILKDQFEVFVQKQEGFDKQWLHYKDEVKEQVAKVKLQFNTEYKDLLA
jgi:hypothetical protein